MNRAADYGRRLADLVARSAASDEAAAAGLDELTVAGLELAEALDATAAAMEAG
jgi:hypothetical protein